MTGPKSEQSFVGTLNFAQQAAPGRGLLKPGASLSSAATIEAFEAFLSRHRPPEKPAPEVVDTDPKAGGDPPPA